MVFREGVFVQRIT